MGEDHDRKEEQMKDPSDEFKLGDGLLLVVVQVDFCPDGALPVVGSDEIVPILNRWIAAARHRGIPVYASRDWHPVRHVSFEEEGGRWPPHCIQDTEGAAFHPGLRLPLDAIKVTKGVRFDQDQNFDVYAAPDPAGVLCWRRPLEFCPDPYGKGIPRP
jgi:nicotinamidase/pyrazinamidase